MASKQLPKLKLIVVQGMCIFRQLKVEEALLRNSAGNWFIVNDGAANAAVVMGISGKTDVLLNVDLVRERKIPIIKRFSGGGTVVVDKDTVFTTVVCSAEDFGDIPQFPRPIMQWAEDLYRPAFAKCPSFLQRENDFVLGELKCGGNAQAITRRRWLQHTSFLWDYSPHSMDLLKMPPKCPDYRKGREHGDFLCKLSSYFPSRVAFLDVLLLGLEKKFQVTYASIKDAEAALETEHISSTKYVEA
eukprot:jgi/Mesvir1/28313/Mv04833-RA.1